MVHLIPLIGSGRGLGTGGALESNIKYEFDVTRLVAVARDPVRSEAFSHPYDIKYILYIGCSSSSGSRSLLE